MDRIKLEIAEGRLAPGAFADIVVFDPQTIHDHATFTEPRQRARALAEAEWSYDRRVEPLARLATGDLGVLSR